MYARQAFYDSLPPAQLETVLLYFLGRFTVEKQLGDWTYPEAIEETCYRLQERMRRLRVELVFERDPPNIYSRCVRSALAELIDSGVEFHGQGGLVFPEPEARRHVLTLRHTLSREQLFALDLLFPSFAMSLREQANLLFPTFH